MVVNVTELKRGDILEIDGDPWQATEGQSQTPSGRGGGLVEWGAVGGTWGGEDPGWAAPQGRSHADDK